MRINNAAFFALVEEQLQEGQQVKIALQGTSMLPTLHDEDFIVLEPLTGEPAIGDVLLFRVNGCHVAHRLIRREGDHYIMQGDNNYTTEEVGREGLLARLVAVERPDGVRLETSGTAWQRISRHALRRKKMLNLAHRWLGQKGRRQLRPWYFLGLAFLMWAPLNGVSISLNNFILGLRMDHLLHASVFIPCSLFLIDLFTVKGKKWAVLATTVAIGLLAESIQWLLPYRGFDINDMVSNFLGISIGWLVIIFCQQGGHRRRQCPVRAKHGECK